MFSWTVGGGILIAYIADIKLFSPLYTVQESLTCIAESIREKDICIKHIVYNFLVFVGLKSKNREFSLKQGAPAMQGAAPQYSTWQITAPESYVFSMHLL